ncbi:excinuclease ABC subunit UvrC [Sedimentibacter sp. zth1]|uniref:excinuclease ABC subunit UvrC n=1 Tax=Sedimentibacter sp. zth1 TaxID=2816908 RepID=UPI00211181F0|nr:excinuclease ABC subunit UvrC [Sedimentibacter sp. zth1]
MDNFNIPEELKKIPDNPGVYLMKNSFNDVIYVGKAKNLKRRVRQYFQSRNHSTKIENMIKNINYFEYIMTDTEVEALILEANLIKKYMPKYNTLLRDDKQYPYIKITTNEMYPRIMKVRQVKRDGCKYYGPYISNYAVSEIIEIVGNLFKLRKCNMSLNGTKKCKRPCLNYHINKCAAPCMGIVDKDVYRREVDKVIGFLNGGGENIISTLKESMINASKSLDFELAAKYRDQIRSVEIIHEKQKIDVATTNVDQDVIGTAIGIEEACVQVFFIRNGKIMGREHFLLTNIENETREEIVTSFITQFYTGTVYIPKEILLECEVDEKELFENLLTEKRGNKVTIKTPIKGEKNMLVKMVKKNALEVLEKGSARIKKEMENSKIAIEALKDLLELKEAPYRIEAFDISNIQGVESVGSMVVFENGMASKSNYRRFKIKTVIGPDDYKSMEEVLERRLNRGLSTDGERSFNKIPDLMLIDGGKGQTGIAERVVENFGLNIPVCGMVKDDKHTTNGLLYKGVEIPLKRTSEVYKLVWKIQEEAHRFAINYHRNLRDKTVFKSELDNIKGVGEKRKISLLRYFGSVNEISKKTENELVKAPTMNIAIAKVVYNYFHEDNHKK